MTLQKPSDAENEYFIRKGAEDLARLAHERERAGVGATVTGGLCIDAGMPVLCSEGEQIAVVDHMEGQSIVKLKKDEHGQHHYIPTSWITSTRNAAVKLDRRAEQVMKDWLKG